MKTCREPLEGTPIERLTVSDPGETDHYVGEVVAYRCSECGQADETLEQIWHQEACELAGEHGRAHYDQLEPDIPGRPIPELDPDIPIDLVRESETDKTAGKFKNEIIAFRCQCGNADEDLFEIVHDEGCPLADDGGALTQRLERFAAQTSGPLRVRR